MIIHKALLNYGYSNFKLEILEFCKKNEVLVKEQYYMDLIKPEYNILKKAGSPLGFKHSEETISKWKLIRKNMTYSDEHKLRISKLSLFRSDNSRKKDIERLNLINFNKGFPIEVENVLTGEKIKYPSIRKAASELKFSTHTIRKYLKNKETYKKTYKFS